MTEETGFKTELILVTPELAQVWLDTMLKNRRVSKMTVDDYALSIMCDEWRRTADFIKFDEDNHLVDGQHRLLGVIKAEKAQYFDVAYNLSRDVQQFLDIGRKRTVGDTLSMDAIQYPSQTSAALRYLNSYKGDNPNFSSESKNKISNRQILELFQLHGGIERSARIIMSLNFIRKYTRASISIACHYLMSISNSNKNDVFWDNLEKGVNLSNISPILCLRERLIDNRISKSSLPPETMGALILKSWKAFKDDKQMRVLKYNKGESFPIDI